MAKIHILLFWWYGGVCFSYMGNAKGSPSSSDQVVQTDEDLDRSCPNQVGKFFHQISFQSLQVGVIKTALKRYNELWLPNYSENALLDGANRTDNKSSPVPEAPVPRYECKPRLDGLNNSVGVILVNSTELVCRISHRPNANRSGNSTRDSEEDSQKIPKKGQVSENVCVIVLFYSVSCRFSAGTAPEYNALGRALYGVDVLAFDINQSQSINSRYGIVAVPSIVLFHNGKLAARFNESKRTLENMAGFIHNLTGLSYNASVIVTPDDHEGPVPTVAIIGPDYLLWFSNTFLFLCALGLLQQKVGAAVWAHVVSAREYVLQVWRTGEIYEQVGIADAEHEELNDMPPEEERDEEVR